MLQSAKQMTVSFHAELYNLIPEDHLLRKIHEVIDFSFIYEIVRTSYCEYYGDRLTNRSSCFVCCFFKFSTIFQTNE